MGCEITEGMEDCGGGKGWGVRLQKGWRIVEEGRDGV